MARPLDQASVVITGASSAIGRATALAMARRGAGLTLAARNTAELEPVAAGCRAAGAAGTIGVATDVADEAAVPRLAERAVQAHGRIDA
jgi:NADP-dependent 3-hydroxy acid dehydrogenase YdfG